MRKRKVKKRSTFRDQNKVSKRSKRGLNSLRAEMRKIDGVRKNVPSSTKLGDGNNVYVFRTGKYSQKIVDRNTRERIKEAS